MAGRGWGRTFSPRHATLWTPWCNRRQRRTGGRRAFDARVVVLERPGPLVRWCSEQHADHRVLAAPGWLVAPDDEGALAAALADVVNDPVERGRRGQAACRTVREQYSWPRIGGRLATVLDDVVTEAVASDALSLHRS